MNTHIKTRGYEYEHSETLCKYIVKTFEEVKNLLLKESIPYEISIRQIMSVLRKFSVQPANTQEAFVEVFARAFTNGMLINNMAQDAISSVQNVVQLNGGNYETECKESRKEDYGKEKKKADKKIIEGVKNTTMSFDDLSDQQVSELLKGMLKKTGIWDAIPKKP